MNRRLRKTFFYGWYNPGAILRGKEVTPAPPAPYSPTFESYLETEACRTVVSNALSEIKDLDGDYTFSQGSASLRPEYDGTVQSPLSKVGAFFQNDRVAYPATASNHFIDPTNGQMIAAVLGNLTSNVSFYSKLDSQSLGVISSEIGFNLDVVGTPTFVPCKYGNGINCATTNNYARKLSAYSGELNRFAVEFWWKPTHAWNTAFSFAEAPLIWFGPVGSAVHYVRIQRYQGGGTNVWWLGIRYNNTNYMNLYINTDTTWSASDLLHIGVTFDASAAAADRIQLRVNNVRQSNGTIFTNTDWTDVLNPGKPYDFAIGHSAFYSNTNTFGPIDQLKFYDYPKTDFSDSGTIDVLDSTIVGKWNTDANQRRFVFGLKGYTVSSQAGTYNANETVSYPAPGGACDILIGRWKPGVSLQAWINGVSQGTASSPASGLSGTVNQPVKIGARSDNYNSLQPANLWALGMWNTGQFSDQQVQDLDGYLRERYISA